MERRLLPAMNTCRPWPAARKTSSRVARNSQLLRTRSRSNWNARTRNLAQMNRRAKLSCTCETVEGLSVVAITYYASQLVQYMAKGLKHAIEPSRRRPSPPPRSRSSRSSSPWAPAACASTRPAADGSLRGPARRTGAHLPLAPPGRL